MKVAINGLGRIGRMVLRHYLDVQPQGVEIVAANDLAPVDDLAYLVKYDSTHGRAPFAVEFGSDSLFLGGREIRIFSSREPKALPWKELNVDVVLECTGLFTAREGAAQHLAAGARRVIISAPSPDADLTVVLGVNEDEFDPGKHFVISNASCTTNSLAPPLKVLLAEFGVEKALVTTVHAYSGSQGLLDKPAKKRIRGRSAAVSLIPTTTGADMAAIQVLPVLKDRLKALAIRAPLPVGAITDISAVLGRSVTAGEVNSAFRAAAGDARWQGILGYTDEELVSADIVGDTRSAIVNGLSTTMVQGNMVKSMVWYDNEFGYSRRLLDLVIRLPL